MNNNNTNNLPASHHLKNLKQQYNDRKLIHLIIDLVRFNDHDTLAFIARTFGIPPQLRHLVWPILLKYHPMCISPNIVSNLVSWDSQSRTYKYIQPPHKKNKLFNFNSNSNPNSNSNSNSNNSPTSNPNKDLEYIIIHDLKKYFHSRTNNRTAAIKTTTSKATTANNNLSPSINTILENDYAFNPTSSINQVNNNISNSLTMTDSINSATNNVQAKYYENHIINLLKDAIIYFLNKWSSIFKYETGLAWVALGLAEWFPVMGSAQNPIILTGRIHSKDQKEHSSSSTSSSSHLNNDPPHTTDYERCNINSSKDYIDFSFNYGNDSINNLYKEYPLPKRLKDKLPDEYQFQFNEMLERLLLIILHCPDTVLAKDQINKKFPEQSSNMSNYFPILSGGDLTFQSQIFFKIFSSILPELYQTLIEENNFPQTSSSRNTWLYWWIKFSGAKVLHRQDRGRLWDILLGWRPKPNMDSINFYLNYNTKIFDHIYKINPIGLNKLYDLCLGNSSTTISKSKNKKRNTNFNNSYHNSLNINKGDSIITNNYGMITKLNHFWFPDLNSVPFGSPEYPFDYNIFKELLSRNKYENSNATTTSSSLSKISTTTPLSSKINQIKSFNSLSSISSTTSSSVLLTDMSTSSEEDMLENEDSCSDNDNSDNHNDNEVPNEENYPLIYSLIDPHIEILFIYMAILQYNEFRLLEYEETEISEFTNNIPMCSRTDDFNYRQLYLMEELNTGTKTSKVADNDLLSLNKKTVKSYSISTASLPSRLSGLKNDKNKKQQVNQQLHNHIHRRKNTNISSKSHMFIEVGNDAKATHSFNDLLTIAGDIWRKWLWKELEENLNSE